MSESHNKQNITMVFEDTCHNDGTLRTDRPIKPVAAFHYKLVFSLTPIADSPIIYHHK